MLSLKGWQVEKNELREAVDYFHISVDQRDTLQWSASEKLSISRFQRWHVNCPERRFDFPLASSIAQLTVARVPMKQMTMQRSSLLLVTLSMLATLGCGSPQRPVARVTTAVGTTSPCEYCGKTISAVTDEQYAVVGPSRFVVCDAQCQQLLSQQMDSQ